MMILSIVATVVLLGALFYHRVSLLLSSVILLAWTAALGAAGVWNIWLLLPLAIILLPFNFAPMRKSMISAPAFRTFRKVMPPMSRTEKEAIDAGTTWWEGDLFRGNPDWQKLHNYPQPRLTAEEQAFLDGPVEEACRMANDFAITHEMADLPPELWAYLKEHRFFAMIIKKEYGGLEFSAYAQARVLQKLSGVSGILAITVGVPNSLGPGELLQHYGTEEQKNHYLPRVGPFWNGTFSGKWRRPISTPGVEVGISAQVIPSSSSPPSKRSGSESLKASPSTVAIGASVI